MNNIDMSKIMGILSNLDKKDLEAGITKANEILKSKNKEDIMNEINKKNQ